MCDNIPDFAQAVWQQERVAVNLAIYIDYVAGLHILCDIFHCNSAGYRSGDIDGRPKRFWENVMNYFKDWKIIIIFTS